MIVSPRIHTRKPSPETGWCQERGLWGQRGQEGGPPAWDPREPVFQLRGVCELAGAPGPVVMAFPVRVPSPHDPKLPQPSGRRPALTCHIRNDCVVAPAALTVLAASCWPVTGAG